MGKRKHCPAQFVLPLVHEISFPPLKRRRGRPKGSRKEPDHNDFDWPVEEAATKLSDAVMEDALNTLRSHQAPDEDKREAFDWLNEPIVSGRPLPFSFQDCAVRQGYDPEELQSLLVAEVRRQRIIEIEEKKEPAPVDTEARQEIIDAVLFGIEMEARHQAGETKVATEAA